MALIPDFERVPVETDFYTNAIDTALEKHEQKQVQQYQELLKKIGLGK